jgi:phage gpG-like protein
MGRQRCLLAALAQQVDGTTLARNWPKVARALRDEMQTSVAATDLPAWAGLAGRVRNGTMRSLVLTDEVVSTARPDVARIRAQVASGLRPDGRDPAVQDVRSTC